MSVDAGAFISTRQIGDAVVTLVWEMTGPAPIALNVPESVWRADEPEIAEADRVMSGMTSTIVQLGSAVIVIDPCFDDPGSRLRNEVDRDFPHWDKGPGLQAVLDGLNIANDEVTDVIITHAHFDHCLGLTREKDGALLPRFPAARHVLGKADWREPDARSATPSPAADNVFVRWTVEDMWPRLQVIMDAGLLDLVDGPHSIAPGVAMMPAPGESPGHAVVRIASGDDVFYHLGDLVHYWFEFAHLDWIINEASSERDADAMLASRQALLPAIARERATVTFSHAAYPGWGRIVESGDGFRWESLA